MININLKPKLVKIEAGTLVQCIDIDGDYYHKYGIVYNSPDKLFVGVIIFNDDGSVADYFNHYKNQEDLLGHFKIVSEKEQYNIDISLK